MKDALLYEYILYYVLNQKPREENKALHFCIVISFWDKICQLSGKNMSL